ncbi:MAG: hypothetical protein R6V53_00070 [Candidatus Woesearchaeota archaeon]
MGIVEKVMHLEGATRTFLPFFLSNLAMIKAYSQARTPMLKALARERPRAVAPCNPVTYKGLNFRNDLGNAAGFDKDGDLLPFSYSMGAGFAVVGTVLNEPHSGNYMKYNNVNPWVPLPRSRAAINSLGLPSKGADAVIRNIDSFRQCYEPKDFPIGVSIMGHPRQDRLTSTIDCMNKVIPYADFIEVNESCPNVCHDIQIEHRIESLIRARDKYQPSQEGKFHCL